VRILTIITAVAASAFALAGPASANPAQTNPHEVPFNDSFVHSGGPSVFDMIIGLDAPFRASSAAQARAAVLKGAALALEERRYAEATQMLEGLDGTTLAGTRMAGIAHAGLGDLEAAEARFRWVVRMNPRDFGSQAALGVVHLRMGKRSDAEAALRTLKRRQEICASACERADAIDKATEALTRALG
jgi:hypothetical protein